MKHLWRVICLAICAIALVGCRESAQLRATSNPNVQISLERPAAPYTVGQDALIILVMDAANQPISGAVVEVIGDMNHAGMQPVSGKTETDANGRYTIPFQWTMGGDWILTVTVTLPDGTRETRQFDVSVSAN